MSRQPVDQLAKMAKPHGQDGIWVQIRRLGIFNLREISDATDIPNTTVRDYVKRLCAGGYVSEHSIKDNAQRYQLILDCGVHAPRLSKDGQPVTQGKGVENMWRSMRMLKVFSATDLALHSTTETVTVKTSTAKDYCNYLFKARYLRVEQEAVPGRGGAVYRFVRNTGPRPPKIQRIKQVFDPNLGKVTYRAGGDNE